MCVHHLWSDVNHHSSSTVETAEILDEQVTVLLSREYFNLLGQSYMYILQRTDVIIIILEIDILEMLKPYVHIGTLHCFTSRPMS